MSATLIQGHLDSACGFYSVLNAISEVNDMGLERLKEIFDVYCRNNRDVVGRGHACGLHFSTLRYSIVPGIIAHLKESETVDYSFPFASIKFSTVDAYTEDLRRLLDTPNRAAVLGFGEPWHHWTTATHVSDYALILKDSTYQKRKMIKSLALATDDKAWHPKNITVIHSRQTILFK